MPGLTISRCGARAKDFPCCRRPESVSISGSPAVNVGGRRARASTSGDTSRDCWMKSCKASPVMGSNSLSSWRSRPGSRNPLASLQRHCGALPRARRAPAASWRSSDRPYWRFGKCPALVGPVRCLRVRPASVCPRIPESVRSENHDCVDLPVGEPVRIDRPDRGQGAVRAIGLAALHREQRIGVLVARDDFEARSEDGVHHQRVEHGAGCGAGRAEDDLGLPRVVDRPHAGAASPGCRS